jgi:hypothetical protein
LFKKHCPCSIGQYRRGYDPFLFGCSPQFAPPCASTPRNNVLRKSAAGLWHGSWWPPTKHPPKWSIARQTCSVTCLKIQKSLTKLVQSRVSKYKKDPRLQLRHLDNAHKATPTNLVRLVDVWCPCGCILTFSFPLAVCTVRPCGTAALYPTADEKLSRFDTGNREGNRCYRLDVSVRITDLGRSREHELGGVNVADRLAREQWLREGDVLMGAITICQDLATFLSL